MNEKRTLPSQASISLTGDSLTEVKKQNEVGSVEGAAPGNQVKSSMGAGWRRTRVGRRDRFSVSVSVSGRIHNNVDVMRLRSVFE
jgi:hypothetical protein